MDRSAGRLASAAQINSGPGFARCALWAAVLVGASGVGSAQAISKDPPSTDGQPTYRLQTSVRRVYVDAVVTDAKGHPVKGLKSGDFQVYEDGVPQPMRGFDVHERMSADQGKAELSLDLPPNTFANLVRAPVDAPVTVILYDLVNTPIDAMPYAHEAIVKFIKEQKSGSRIAIFVLGSRLRMLQGFTDDETRLMAAINNKAARPQQSAQLMTDTTASTQLAGIVADLPVGGTTILSGLKSLESTENTLLLRQRLELTVSAFAQIARFVSTLRGRKNLIWLSGSFPSGVLPSGDSAANGTANEFGDTYSLGAQVKDMDNQLNVDHVVVYPVDVRGLQVNPAFSAANNARPGPVPSQTPDTFSTQQQAEHGTMDSIAESTGGRAFYNTNGLEEAMQSAIEDGSSYYTLTYEPTNAKQDGALRHIKVQLREPGYQLEYRRSYFAGSAAHATELTDSIAPKPKEDVFLDAGMQHGAPISPELFFETSVYPVGGVLMASAEEMAALAEFLKTKRGNKAPVSPEPVKVQHYRVNYVVLGRQLSLPPTANGKYATAMRFALAAYSPDSLIVNGLEVSVKNEVSLEQLRKIRAQGYHTSMIFVVPVEASAMRLAAVDGIGNRMGTIEVPLPLAAPRQTTAAPAAVSKAK